MNQYTRDELSEAYRQFISLIEKSEKVLIKLKEKTSQYTLTTRRITAYRIAITLINNHLKEIH